MLVLTTAGVVPERSRNIYLSDVEDINNIHTLYMANLICVSCLWRRRNSLRQTLHQFEPDVGAIYAASYNGYYLSLPG